MARLSDDLAVVARHLERDDFADRCDKHRQWLDERTATVVVGGSFKQGKTTLVEALLDERALLGHAEHATSAPITYHFALDDAVTVHFDDGSSSDVAPGDLFAFATHASAATAAEPLVTRIDVQRPAALLASGMSITDLPGIGTLTAGDALESVAHLQRPDVIVWVTDAGAPLNAEEVASIRRVGATSSIVALVESRVDLHPQWRTVLELDTEAADGSVAVVAAVAAELAVLDPVEAGIDALRRWIAGVVGSRVIPARLVIVGAELLEILHQLRHVLAAEADALRGPSDAEAALADATVRRGKLDAARWQTTLSDGMADLAAEIDHDLRLRVREAGRLTDAAVDEGDPADNWLSIAALTRRQCSDIVVEHFRALDDQVGALVARVLAMVDADIAELRSAGAHRVADCDALAAGIEADRPEFDRPGRAGTALSVMRSAYGSSLLLGFIGTAAGVTLAAPVALLAGAAMGARGLRKEREKQLAGRRSLARQAARRHLDETAFVLGKRSRDAVREVQRRLRDEVAGTLRELERTLDAEIRATREAIATDRRAERMVEVGDEIERLDALAELVSAVARAAAAGVAGEAGTR